MERLASSLFWDERSSQEFESPARCRNVKQWNKNFLRFGESKIGLIIFIINFGLVYMTN
jgi:hypothetical protein